MNIETTKSFSLIRSKIMFNIPLYQYKIDNWQEKKQKLLEICSTIDFKNQDIANVQLTNIDADNVYTDYGNKRNKNYKPNVEKILSNELRKFQNDAKLNEMSMGEAWFQQYYKTQFHSPHNHGPCGYSSVTYIKFNKDKHIPTIFIAPFNDPRGDVILFSPKVDEGDIIFFPSMITHYVQPNKSKDIRIILSFNINIT